MAGRTSTAANTNTTGTQNTYLGADSGPGTVTQLDNTTAIGYGSRVTASNQVVIGNTSVTQTLLNGNVGVGTVAPTSNLHVQSSGGADASIAIKSPANGSYLYLNSANSTYNWNLRSLPNGIFAINEHGWGAQDYIRFEPGLSASSPPLFLANTGNVGIGTTSPQATLDVNGYARLKTYSGAPPVACAAGYAGSIALNTSYIGCVCNGTSWVRISDGSTSCTWP